MAEALAAYEQLAAAVLPQEIRDFVADGSGTETTLAAEPHGPRQGDADATCARRYR